MWLLELDEDYVEARANLGCVLAETGYPDSAIAAFEGALARHPEYADAVFHLARTLDDAGHQQEALNYWRLFLTWLPIIRGPRKPAIAWDWRTATWNQQNQNRFPNATKRPRFAERRGPVIQC